MTEEVQEVEFENEYIAELVNESSAPMEEEESLFEMNEEGVYGDEWKKDKFDEINEKLKKERNKKNAERRIKNKSKDINEDPVEDDEDFEDNEKIDSSELVDHELELKEKEYYQTSLEEANKKIASYEPAIEFLRQNGLNREELTVGSQFVKEWKEDKIGCVRKLLTSLDKEGIDLDTILLHEARPSIEQEVNRRMQPMQQQYLHQQQEARTRKTVDTFLQTHPDAIDHLEEIEQVMRRANLHNPYEAYFRLRRAYQDNGVSWIEEAQPKPVEQPQRVEKDMFSRNVNPVNFEEAPSNIRDIIRRETNKFF